jgi:hypothetical protein
LVVAAVVLLRYQITRERFNEARRGLAEREETVER